MAERRAYGSGRIVERSPGYWQVTVELGRDPVTRRRRRRRFAVRGSRRAAQRALTEAMAARDRGIDLNPSGVLLGDYLDRWLEEHARLRVKGSTFARYRQLARRIKPFLGDFALRDLRPPHIQRAYAALLGEGLTARTVLHHHRLLKQALNQAVRWGLLASNPADAVTPPRVERREMRTLTAEDVALVEGAATDDEFRRLIRVAVTTGLRLGELLGLQWKDIDFEGGRMLIQRTASYQDRETTLGPVKTGRSHRPVALSEGTLAVLREHRASQRAHRLELGPAYRDFDLVFPAADGSVQPPYRISGRFKDLVARVSLEGVRFHDLRHTMATLALGAGVHVKVISERLGHSTTQITLDTYSHVSPDLQREAAEVLDGALRLRRDPAS